ncbi:MAG: CBS domain-containing protein [Myxococcales bacterium]
MQNRVADVLFHKGHQVYSVQPDATVRVAVDTMARHNVGALIVLSARGHVIGVLSERDVLWRIVHESRPPETLVVEVMAQDPVLISPDMRVSEAMRVMTERRIRHLPVVDRDRNLIGLISIGDLTKWVTRDLENHVGELASYICGTQVEVRTIL